MAWTLLVFDANVVTIVVMATNLNFALWREFVVSLFRYRDVEFGVINLDVAPIFGYIERRRSAIAE